MPINEKLTTQATGWTAWCQSARSLAPETRSVKQPAAPSNENSAQDKQHANR